nr:MAG TPA: hypothetical protein [Caudoviricetes sp.]
MKRSKIRGGSILAPLCFMLILQMSVLYTSKT